MCNSTGVKSPRFFIVNITVIFYQSDLQLEYFDPKSSMNTSMNAYIPKLKQDLFLFSVPWIHRAKHGQGSVSTIFREKIGISAYKFVEKLIRQRSQKYFPANNLRFSYAFENHIFSQIGFFFKTTSGERLAKCRILDESLILDEK